MAAIRPVRGVLAWITSGSTWREARASARPPAVELREPDRGLNRVEPQARVHSGERHALDVRPVHGVRQRAAGRAGHGHLMGVPHAGQHAHKGHLGAAPGGRVIGEEDPHQWKLTEERDSSGG